jgi:hypothetical protein
MRREGGREGRREEGNEGGKEEGRGVIANDKDICGALEIHAKAVEEAD